MGLTNGVDLDLSRYGDADVTGIGELVGLLNGQYGVILANNIYGGRRLSGGRWSPSWIWGEVYRQYVEELSPEGGGYIVVKDGNGTVILHPRQEMIRFNYRRDLEGFDTYPRYESLRSMLDTQYSVEEGSSVYTEYSNNIMPSTELMASFSRMNLDGCRLVCIRRASLPRVHECGDRQHASSGECWRE